MNSSLEMRSCDMPSELWESPAASDVMSGISYLQLAGAVESRTDSKQAWKAVCIRSLGYMHPPLKSRACLLDLFV
jgi:hypothetical protein